MNTPVNPEIAKLLKIKNFKQNIEQGVICRITNKINPHYEKVRAIHTNDIANSWCVFEEVYPTIAEVIMWLYEKHGIWIVSLPELINGTDITYYPYVYEGGVGEDLEFCFNLPTEAYEAAIEYCLTNLI